ncbi:MAG: phosphomannomutase [Candidatus Taylorbacteria bacterium]|nr:phosphomannomutase [Candidatus Taylorbacteria bacterium]
MSLNKKIFKAYDVRGIYPADVNTESITVIAHSLATLLPSGSIVVARDGRHGGEELAGVVEKEIVSFGEALGKKFEIISVGLSTTPMFYFLVNHFNASGGAMITASHNPKEYSGVKAVKEKALPFSGIELLKTIEEHGI